MKGGVHPSFSNAGMEGAWGSGPAPVTDVELAPHRPHWNTKDLSTRYGKLFLVENSTIPWPCQPAELEKHEYDKSIDKSGSHLGKPY